MTIHNEAKKEDIANVVIMPGDPLRAKYIAENFLDNYKLVNSIRSMYAYTGEYKGKRVTVMAHGMGMPSIGIYCYELYKFYDVDTIIRIGSCGAYSKDLQLFDIVLSENCYSESNFALTMNNEECHLASSSTSVNDIIKETAKENNMDIHVGNTLSLDYFDLYASDMSKVLSRVPEGFNPLTSEMEAFALFLMAKKYDKDAACILTVVDSMYDEKVVSSEDREKSLDDAIKLTLETLIS